MYKMHLYKVIEHLINQRIHTLKTLSKKYFFTDSTLMNQIILECWSLWKKISLFSFHLLTHSVPRTCHYGNLSGCPSVKSGPRVLMTSYSAEQNQTTNLHTRLSECPLLMLGFSYYQPMQDRNRVIPHLVSWLKL